MARAIWGDIVIAESDDTVVVEGNHYFPRDSVKPEYLEESSTTTVCGWKGTASYHHIVVNGRRSEDAAWYYPDPKAEAVEITDRLAFWKDITVTT
ncbi:MAG: DUF427 domain-containing protein [Actinomycetota bacterium]